MKKLRNWMERNSVDKDRLNEIDIDAELRSDLSYSEAVELAIHKFPAMWREDFLRDYEQMPKQIIFVHDLVDRIIEVTCKLPIEKVRRCGHTILLKIDSSRNPIHQEFLIEFYQTDKVDPYKLSDEEAQLAGVESAQKIRELFEKWYGNRIPTLYRNWFKVKDKPEMKIN
jgi:hypothetical protein